MMVKGFAYAPKDFQKENLIGGLKEQKRLLTSIAGSFRLFSGMVIHRKQNFQKTGKKYCFKIALKAILGLVNLKLKG